MKIRKILILKLSPAEELILTTPVIRALKTQLDEVAIHYCTKPQNQALLSANPYVDRFYLLTDSIRELIRQLKSEKYDAVVDLQHDLQSNFISFFLRTRTFRPDRLIREIWMMVNMKINRLPNVHLVDRYMEAVKSLHVKADKMGLDYFIPEKDEIEESWIPETHRKELVVFGIGARKFTKKLPINKMIELCDKINHPVILLGGKEDHHTGDEILAFFERRPEGIEFESGLKKMDKKTRIFNGCGKFNINQSACIVKRAKYVFTHDSLIMQIAAAYKKQIFSIWGNTIPLFGSYPYKTKFVVFENNKLNCRPCSKTGYNKCPKGHFKCMNDIVFDFYLP